MKQKTISYLDILRILAIILVITIHTAAQIVEGLPVKSAGFFFANFYDLAGSVGVPLFVMISGALLLREDYALTLSKILLRKVPHFILLYYVWKICYELISMIDLQIPFTITTIKEHVILVALRERGYYHIWFLPMIIGIYLCIPLIKKALQSKQICIYFLTFFFVTYLLLPIMNQFDFPFRITLMQVVGTFDFSHFGGYLGYFVLGHFLGNVLEIPQKSKRIGLYVIGILSFLLLPVLSFYCSYVENTFSGKLSTPFSPFIFFILSSLFIGLRVLDSSVSVGASTTLHKLSTLSFGIYLIHPAILLLFERIGFTPTLFTPVLSIPVLVLATYLVCVIITFLLTKIPILKRLVQ